MAMRNMKRGVPNLFKDGTRHTTGLEAAVLRNLEACSGLSSITKTSFGPNGMNKLIINHLEKMFVTSDTATLLNEMEVQHPAAKMIAMAAVMQEQEIGDGSNFVICIAGSLLLNAMDLVKMGLHPSEIVAGYTTAGKKALEILDDLVVHTVTKAMMFDKDALTVAIKSSIMSKQLGHEDLLAPKVAEACLAVMPKNPYNFNVDNVRIAKIMGGDLSMTEVVRGVVLPTDSIGSCKKVANAQVAVFTCNLGAAETETKGTVLIQSAKDLLEFNVSEEKEIERLIKTVKMSGVDVIVCNGSVDDMAKHFCERAGLMVLKISSKFELQRLCRAVGATPQVALGPVSKEHQGFCSKVYVREVGLRKITIFAQDDNSENNVATILLRASTGNVLSDVEKALDDGVNTIKAMGKFLGEDGAKFVAGAGAAEIELARRLYDFGSKSSGLDQYSIKKFAQALEIVPRCLAENCGQNPMDSVSALYAAHERGEATAGIDINVYAGTIDAKEQHIYDLYATKVQALKLAIDAAVTILRVDQIIQAKPAGGPKVPGGQPPPDND